MKRKLSREEVLDFREKRSQFIAYFNPQDDNIIVAKKRGIKAYDLNYGNYKTWIGLAVFLSVIAMVLYFLVK